MVTYLMMEPRNCSVNWLPHNQNQFQLHSQKFLIIPHSLRSVSKCKIRSLFQSYLVWKRGFHEVQVNLIIRAMFEVCILVEILRLMTCCNYRRVKVQKLFQCCRSSFLGPNYDRSWVPLSVLKFFQSPLLLRKVTKYNSFYK